MPDSQPSLCHLQQQGNSHPGQNGGRGPCKDAPTCATLTPYSVDARYPGDLPEPTLGESRQALTLAESVRDAILNILEEIR